VTTYEDLGESAHIRLTTFRPNGQAVGTPVWTAADPDRNVLYTVTGAASGKVKRILTNPHVTVAPSNWQGRPKGDAIDATARVIPPDENPEVAGRADTVLVNKYAGRKPGIELLRGLQRQPWVLLEISLGH
jgi:PPOX class probable F420-dependent enzyme